MHCLNTGKVSSRIWSQHDGEHLSKTRQLASVINYMFGFLYEVRACIDGSQSTLTVTPLFAECVQTVTGSNKYLMFDYININ